MSEILDLDKKVLTPKGVRKISSLVEGDEVIDYVTGGPIKIESIGRMTIDHYVSIIYSDGRGLIVPSNQFLYDGLDVMDLDTFEYKCKNGMIRDLPVWSYEFTNYSNDLFDPYVVGMLYAYGIWGKSLGCKIKLPCNITDAYDKLSHNLDHEYLLLNNNDPKGDYVEFLKSPGSPLNLFSPPRMRYNDIIYPEYKYEYKSLDERPIPSRYLYSSKEIRMKFLSGIFNFGNVAIPRDTGEITLFCDNIYVVNEIQKMLRSLGLVVTSRVNMQIEKLKYGTDYQIRILKRDNKVARFLYDIDLIHKLVENTSTKNYSTIPYFNLVPTFIRDHHKPVFMYNIVCDQPHRVFTTSNFLPMVSL